MAEESFNPNSIELPAPAVYIPFRDGKYNVAPGLNRLGTDFGNGAADGHVFQIDRDWQTYRTNKMNGRLENFDKYVCYDGFDERTRRSVGRLMAQRLAIEHPDLFNLATREGGMGELSCRLTDENLIFDAAVHLATFGDRYRDTFDALCCQIQEDVAVIRRTEERGDWVCAFHACSPSRWSPHEKLGKSFETVHLTIPGISRTLSASSSLVEMMIHGTPYTRFVWSIEFDDRLNRHPDAPPSVSVTEWNNREFRAERNPPFYVRVERQNTYGMPASDAALFTIRVSHLRGDTVRRNPALRDALKSGLESMSPASRRYKGVDRTMTQILAYLDAPAEQNAGEIESTDA